VVTKHNYDDFKYVQESVVGCCSWQTVEFLCAH